MAAQKFQIFRLTQEAYDQLWLFARENPKAYLDPDIDFGRVLIDRGFTDYAENTGIVANRPISLTPVERVPANRADRPDWGSSNSSRACRSFSHCSGAFSFSAM